MKQLDGRKISREALSEIRIRAVTRVQAGESPEVVVDSLGFSRSCIYDWLSRYSAGGWDALKPRRAPGRKRKLTGPQMKWIYNAIINGDPRQYRFSFALWTREIIRQLLIDKFQVKLGLSSVTRLLRQLGLSCQRPLFRAWEQNQLEVKKWLKKTFPKIRAQAKKEDAIIYFGDEAGIRSDHHSGTTWAKKGETPIVRTTGQRFSVNMISAVSRQGEMRFMVTTEKVGAGVFVEFLKRLMAGTDRTIYLIVDGHPSHRAKRVKEFVAKQCGKLQLFFLPPYSPELNPDEYVWNDVKNNLIGRRGVESRPELKYRATHALRSVQRNKEKVRSFFEASDTRYAA